MGKFNAPVRNFHKEKRTKKSQIKRERVGNPATNKVKIAPPPTSLSGKRGRKLLKKLRREQKKALETGLVSMEDVQMMAMDNQDEVSGEKTQENNARSPMQLHLKKRAKLKINKGKGKGGASSNSSGHGGADAMEE